MTDDEILSVIFPGNTFENRAIIRDCEFFSTSKNGLEISPPNLKIYVTPEDHAKLSAQKIDGPDETDQALIPAALTQSAKINAEA